MLPATAKMYYCKGNSCCVMSDTTDPLDFTCTTACDMTVFMLCIHSSFATGDLICQIFLSCVCLSYQLENLVTVAPPTNGPHTTMSNSCCTDCVYMLLNPSPKATPLTRPASRNESQKSPHKRPKYVHSE